MIFRTTDNRTALQRQLDADARRNRPQEITLDAAAAPGAPQNYANDRLWPQRARSIQFGDFAGELANSTSAE